MFFQAAKNTVFRRYNTAVVVAFIVIILIALTVASVRYFSELTQLKKDDLIALEQKTEQLSVILTQSVQAITGIQEYAQYLLDHPDEGNTSLPLLAQEGELFYLDKSNSDFAHQRKRLSGNITGLGKIELLSPLKKKEIAMAYALTPAFLSAQKIIKEATWFYYVSYQEFVNLYPWVDRDIWQFNLDMLENPHNTALKQLSEEDSRVLWSPPYLDSAGSGMNASLGKGVYYRQRLLGSVVLDINLARLHKSLPEVTHENEGYVLYNQDNHILLFKRQGKEPLSYRASWQELLPESLRQLSAKSLSQLEDSARYGDWLLEKQLLDVNGWTLLKYQDYYDFTKPLRSRFIFVFAMLFIGLLAFLMLVNAMTRRTFIKPTTEFIRHIEYCAQGDPGKVKPTADWLHWFQVVEDIFTQNRSLLLQLKEQNDVLDSRVIEKTKALQETSAKHQRDYVLLRSVMNAIPELIVFNDPQGLLVGCNQAFERITNQKESNMLGIKAATFMPRALAKEIDKLNADNHETYPQQAMIEAGDFIYQGYCNQFNNDEGEMLGTITILRDVTKSHAIRTALEKAKNQAEYANQVKIQFLANMSHEIRTPINAMQGMMDLLDTTALNPRQQHYLLNAQTASVSLLHLVNELLDLSKIEAGKMVVSQEPVNLSQVVNKALKLNVANIDLTQVDLLIDIKADVPNWVLCDEMRLVQVIANLLNNSIKFTDKGHVKLDIDTVAIREKETSVRFRVTDTGIGIAKEKQSRLFKAFSQADESMTRKYGGSGLGLSICQQIIHLLGGEINLSSTLGEGSELCFTLPLTRVEDKEREPVIDKVVLCVIGQTLESSLIDTIEQIGWQHQYFTSLDEFCTQLMPHPVVLLIDEPVLLQSDCKNRILSAKSELLLLGLCQPTMAKLSPTGNETLEQLSQPYLLLDTPLYRYALEQINVTLRGDDKATQEDNETNDQLSPVATFAKLSQKNIQILLPEETSHKPVVNQGDDLNQINVLLVEDNLVNQLVAKELLLNLNAHVIIADNGKVALDTLKNQDFDVVLMDIQMPIMDGLTAAQKIREQQCYQTLPIIAMTAHARAEDKNRSIEAGMNLHIAKPVTKQVLLSSIKQVLAK